MTALDIAAAFPLLAGVSSASDRSPAIACQPSCTSMSDVRRTAADLELTTTIELLSRARTGDAAATNALFHRCIPPLRRWARGRLPSYARDLLDTQDLVQDTVVRMLRHIEHFEAEHEGAVHAYLRQAVLNRIRDEIRRRVRRPEHVELDEQLQAPGASPLQEAIGHEGIERYEAALGTLSPQDREAIVGRVELHYSYKELAVILGKPSPDAARVAVTRALARLLERMGHAV